MFLDKLKLESYSPVFIDLFERKLLEFIDMELRIIFVKELSQVLINHFSTKFNFNRNKKLISIQFEACLTYVDKIFEFIVVCDGEKEVMAEILNNLLKKKTIENNEIFIFNTLRTENWPNSLFNNRCQYLNLLCLNIKKKKPYLKKDLAYIQNKMFSNGYYPYRYFDFEIYFKPDTFNARKGLMEIIFSKKHDEEKIRKVIVEYINIFIKNWNDSSKKNLKLSENKKGVEINVISMSYVFIDILQNSVKFEYEFNFNYAPIYTVFFEGLDKLEIKIKTILFEPSNVNSTP